MSETITTSGGFECFQAGDLIEIDQRMPMLLLNGDQVGTVADYAMPVTYKITEITGCSLTIRPLYWYERLYLRLRVEIRDAFPFIFASRFWLTR